ncbi:MAG TPA: galactitol-1-phosphate 5-dehydrogenase [Clostridiales bacterium]|mgnify:FL=1|nr:galactitol-1-phosphate 5-dehydrogenase [Clostridiales bacterium]
MAQKMRAVRLFAPGDVRCVEVDIPKIEQPDDVIVKVKSCGVCGSDIARVMEKGAYRYPITIGHEFAGEVAEVGSDEYGIEVGDRVAVMPLIPCGKCKYCAIGEFVLCDEYQYYGSRIDGAMAEYIRVKAHNILKMPLGVDYEAGSMVDPTSVGLHAVRKTKIEPGQSGVVFGLGPIGLITMQWLKALGCDKVFAVDIFDDKLDLADRLGADYCINGKKQDAVEAIMELTSGEGVDISIELAGSIITQDQAIRATKKMGTVVYCGISYDDLVLSNATVNRILRGELTIKGSWNSSIAPLPINEWESSLKFMKNGKVKVNPLISHRFRLEECQECFNMMYHKTEVFNKVLFKPED